MKSNPDNSVLQTVLLQQLKGTLAPNLKFAQKEPHGTTPVIITIALSPGGRGGGVADKEFQPRAKGALQVLPYNDTKDYRKDLKEQTRTPPSASSSGEEKHWMHGDEVLLRDIGDAVKLARGVLFCSDFW